MGENPKLAELFMNNIVPAKSYTKTNFSLKTYSFHNTTLGWATKTWDARLNLPWISSESESRYAMVDTLDNNYFTPLCLSCTCCRVGILWTLPYTTLYYQAQKCETYHLYCRQESLGAIHILRNAKICLKFFKDFLKVTEEKKFFENFFISIFMS